MGKVLFFIGGVLVGAVGAFGIVIYLDTHKPAQNGQIMFAKRSFFDTKKAGLEAGFVGISGTLTGVDLAYPNNTYAVGCSKEYKACFVTFVEQIGHNQIGRIQDPYWYPIVKWDDYEVIAQEEAGPIGCYRVIITIDRRSQGLLWLREPINQTQPNCKDTSPNIQKYTLEDSPEWKRVHADK